MRLKTLPIVLFLFCGLILSAEGTKEVAPNASIDIDGNVTTDLAALLINDTRYNTFASYLNPDPNARLNIHIENPEQECIYLGFSFAHPNANSPTPQRYSYEYRVKDPNGNVVFGPVFVGPNDGNIQSWSEAITGPLQLNGAGGYNAMQITPSALTSQGWSGKGDYYVEFQSPDTNNDFLIDFWDISVANCSVAPAVGKIGRVWSYNWAFFAINDYGFPNRPFNGAFYVCAPDPDNADAAFITKIDFNQSGFRPAAFNIAFNSFGIQNTGDIMEDRRSVELTNATQAEYAVFLNDPVDICETALSGNIELLGVSLCPGEAFCIQFVASKEGQIDLLLDFDGSDQVYTPGTADVMLPKTITAEEVGVRACVEWDGLDGLGNAIPADAASQIPVVIAFAQGVYHFPVYDAELMTEGFNIQSVRPLGEKPLLFYDDSNISVPSGSGEPAIQLMGCTLPCHRWTNYTNNTIPGFGNLHTINSWWFSQMVVKDSVFFYPGELQCAIDGPMELCEGQLSTLSVRTRIMPAGTHQLEVIGQQWSGPDVIGEDSNPTVTIGSAGIYFVEVFWTNATGDTCSSVCDIEISALPASFETIDTLIVSGEMIEINGETYSEGGTYMQELTAANGCDSILTIHVRVIQTVVYYDLDACRSYTDDGSAEDYTEFTALIPEPLSCANIQTDFLYRENPMVNMHSCTPGVFDSPAMCVSGLDGCGYDAGNEKSVIFEIFIEPSPDTAVALTSLSFYEKAPEMFDWIDGNSGLNNYPTLYGVRVLKNGEVIFEESDLETTNSWTEEVFNFQGLTDFVVDEPTEFRFELLGYCLVGNPTPVAAWDLDEIQIQASCAAPGSVMREITGTITSAQDMELGPVELHLAKDAAFSNYLIDISNNNGSFTFESIPTGGPYFIRPWKVDDYMRGVSTLDLIRIQRHLLNIEPFDQTFQYIAADANRSNSVSAIDLVEFKKLILGIYEILPKNQSWRFAHQEMNDNPFQMEETVEIEHLATDLRNMRFWGIKIGNVDGSSSNVDDHQVTNRSDQTFEIQFTDRYVQKGDQVLLDLTTANTHSLTGIQFELNTPGFDLQDVFSGKMEVEGQLTYAVNNKSLKMSWHDALPAELKEGDRLFTLKMKAKENGLISQMLSLHKETLTPEAYVGTDLRIVEVVLKNNTSDQNSLHSASLIIVPNPMMDQATIYFNTSQNGDAHIEFYNTSGQLIYQLNRQFQKGTNRVVFSKTDLGLKSGVIFIRIEGKDGTVVKRVILQ